MDKFITVEDLMNKLSEFDKKTKVCACWDTYYWGIRTIGIEKLNTSKTVQEEVLVIDVSD